MFEDSNVLRLRNTTIHDLECVCRLESDAENAQFIIPWSMEKHQMALEVGDEYDGKRIK